MALPVDSSPPYPTSPDKKPGLDLGAFDTGRGSATDEWGNANGASTDDWQTLLERAGTSGMRAAASLTGPGLAKAASVIGPDRLLDVPRIAWNMTASPLLSMWSVPGQAIQSKGAELIYGALGDESSAREAHDRGMNAQPKDFSFPPHSEQGQAAEDAILKLIDESKIAGAVGLHLPPSRGFSPNDLRAAAGEAQNFGKQVKEMPMDFANAKSGFKTIDPITNKPTLGSRLYDIAPGLDTIGDLGPSSGSTAAQRGAIRMPGTQIIRAKDPVTGNLATPKQAESAELDTLAKLQSSPEHTIDVDKPSQSVLGDYKTRYLDNPAINDALDTYIKSRYKELYPAAPNARQAQLAFEARLGGRGSDADTAAKAQMVDDFAKTPGAQQLAQEQGAPLPTVDEYFNMHNAAMKWIGNNLVDYVSKYVGTSNDPLLKAASEGYTFLPEVLIRENGDAEAPYIARTREKAGMPAASALQTAIDAKQAEVDAATQDLEAFSQANHLNNATTNEERRRGRARDQLAKQLENLKLGAMYENVADSVVLPTTKDALSNKLTFAQKQFYPELAAETPPDTPLYTARFLNTLGLHDIAKSVYDDVMSKRIAPEDLNTLKVEQYVRRVATRRAQKEAEEGRAQQNYVKNATAAIAQRVENDPEARQIGGHILLETTSNTPRDVAVQRVSDATAVLDMCVGESGRYAGKGKHPFTGNKANYEPYNSPVTGQRNPKATGSLRNYVNSAMRGDSILAQINDKDTKLPVAMLELHKRSDGKYSVGYVSGATTESGATNGPVAPQYHQAIADYLNERGDISGIESALAENTSVIDTRTNRQAVKILGMDRMDDVPRAHPDLPRFITEDALNAYAATLKQEQQVAPQLPTSRSGETMESLQSALDALEQGIAWAQREGDVDAVNDMLSRTNDINARMQRLTNAQRLANNHANPHAYLYNDFEPYGQNLFLSPNEMRAGQAAIDAIHSHFDEMQMQDNRLYASQQVGSPAVEEVRHNDEAQRIFAGLSHDTRDAVEQYFRDLPTNDMTMMPRYVARMSDPELYGQITNAEIGRLPELGTQLQRRFDANRQHYPSVLAFADEMRHDRPLQLGTQDAIDPAMLEIALRSVAHNNLAGAPAAQANVAIRPWIMEEIQRIRAADGVQVGEQVETILHRTMENHNPDREPAAFANALLDAADRDQNGLVEENLIAIANRVTNNAAGAMPDILAGDWEVDTTHPANQQPAQPAQLLPAEREDILAERHADLAAERHADDFHERAMTAAQHITNMPYAELNRRVLQNNAQYDLVTNAGLRIARQARDFGIDNADELADMIRRRATTFGAANVPLDAFTPDMLELLARDVRDSVNAHNSAAARNAQQQPAALPDQVAPTPNQATVPANQVVAPLGWGAVEAGTDTAQVNTQSALDLAQYLENNMYNRLPTASTDRLIAISNDIARLEGSRPEEGWNFMFQNLRPADRPEYSDMTRHRLLHQLRNIRDSELIEVGSQIMNALDENIFQHENNENARQSIDDTITQLEHDDETGWENTLGMMSTSYTYSPAIRDSVIRELRMLRESYE